MNIDFKKAHKDVKSPKYATDGASGLDLIADNFKQYFETSNSNPFKPHPDEKTFTMFPKSRLLVGTGLFFAIPKGYEMQIRPRSGKALKEGITVLNTPGTIDSDYRGEVGVILYNTSNDAVTIKLGDAIAQGVIQAIEKVNLNEKESLDDTFRGAGGFGHTDNKKQNSQQY